MCEKWRLTSQPQAQRCAGAVAVRAVFDGDAATVERGGFAHEAEAEAGTFAAGAGAGERIETLEESRERVVGNAGAFVLDGNFRSVRRCVGRDSDADAAAVGGKINRVLQEVVERAFEEERFAEHFGPRIAGQVETQVARFRGRLELCADGMCEISERDALGMIEFLPALECGEREEAVYDVLQPPRLGLDIGDEFLATL